MKQILKHSFEAVSLLTTTNGMLDITIVPAFDQPDWVIPTGLILSVDHHQERVSSYHWQQQDVAVFHLLPQDQLPDKIIILEGNTTDHRFALQTAGDLRQMQVRISDVKDIDLPEQFGSSDIDANNEYLDKNQIASYMYQAVMIDDVAYIVADLDKIAHHLVDLEH